MEREVRYWRARAERIPDADLRRLALTNLCSERGNLDGAAAFAAFTPRANRTMVVRAQVAFQIIYDYLDSLAEEPSDDPIRNGRQLHRALLIALDPSAPHLDYYAHHGASRDAGYLEDLVDTCRMAFGVLPSRAVVTAGALRASTRMVAYQSLSHGHHRDASGALARWAARQTPSRLGLHWWEAAAAGASSLIVFALIAAAAEPALDARATAGVERAYFPWIGALHVLLDSFVDRGEDRDAGRHGLVEHYRSPGEAAARLKLLASEASAAAGRLGDRDQLTMLLAGMAGHYLSTPAAALPEARAATRGVLESIGVLSRPTTMILAARRGTTRSASIPVASLPPPGARS